MRTSLRTALVAALTAFALGPPAGAAFDDLEKSFSAFYQAGLDTSGAIGVENLTFAKDAMTFVLKKGILIPMQPLEGEVTGAMFVGEGTATLTPPTPADVWFLKKNYGSGSFSEKFSNLYLRFTDGTEKLFPKPAPGTSQAAVASPIDVIIKTFKERQGATDAWIESSRRVFGSRYDLDLDFMDARISGLRGMDYFYAQFDTSKWGWVTFTFHNGCIEEVSLGHDRTVGAYKDYLPWAQFHKKEDYQQGRYVAGPAADSKEVLDVQRIDMKVSIPTTKTVSIDARLTLAPLVESLSSIRLALVNQLGNPSWRDRARPVTVGSVTDGAGQALPFIHKRNELLIRLPKPIRKGEPYVVQVKADEDTIVQVTAESYLLYNDYPWFPQYGYVGGRYAFDFTVEIQKPLAPIGSGHIVREWEDKERKMNGIELRMDEQVHIPSILFGRFIRESGTYASPVSRRDIAVSVSAFPTITLGEGESVNIPQGKMKGILQESMDVIKFFEQLYGAFPYGDLQVAQMYPGSGFGQAPPALVQLDGFAFLSQAEVTEIFQEGDILHGFLSHEIAHQYWGHKAGWANDREAWLSESFAEYAAGLYVQALQGEKRFQQKLADWKKDARQGDPIAPIALAGLISGDNAGKYIQQLIYNKGPLVVHMIRMQVGNDNFVKAMSNLLTKYEHQNITTEILSRELAAVTGYSWDYFFDQWFRGIGIPEIHYTYKVTPKEGKYLFEMTVSQKDAENFKKILALPVVWKGSGKDQFAVKDFPFGKQGQVIQAMLPFAPKTVEVDPDHHLLAEIVADK